jgi:hypothetical protein
VVNAMYCSRSARFVHDKMCKLSTTNSKRCEANYNSHLYTNHCYGLNLVGGGRGGGPFVARRRRAVPSRQRARRRRPRRGRSGRRGPSWHRHQRKPPMPRRPPPPWPPPTKFKQSPLLQILVLFLTNNKLRNDAEEVRVVKRLHRHLILQ